MATSVYLASLEPAAGKSLVALGVMELLSRRLDRIGYFRPVVPDGATEDHRIELVTGRYPVDVDHRALMAYTAEEVENLLAEGRSDEVMKTILERFRDLQEECEFVLVDGTDFTGPSAALEFEFNAEVAGHLGAPVIALVNGHGRTLDDVLDAVGVARQSLADAGCTLAATIANRVDPALLADVRDHLAAIPGEHEPLYAIPAEPSLGMPTVGEIARAVGAREVRDGGVSLDRDVAAYKIAAMSLANVLDHIVDGALLITPGDRADVILGSMMSHQASTYPDLAGILLTGGFAPDPQVTRLLDGLDTVPVPVLAVDSDTYTAAQDVSGVRGAIRHDNPRKVATALGLFENHVDTAELERRIHVARSQRVTPLMFEYELIERARGDRKRIVLPEGTDDRILLASQILRRRDVVDLTLLGEPDRIRAHATALGVGLEGIDIVDPRTSELRQRFADRYHELRAHKGVTEDAAFELLLDVSYFGTMMVLGGLADGMVSGAAHTTQHTIRPSFEVVKTRPGVDIVSSVFFMCLADRVLVYGDCAINPNPNATELADIAIASAETAAMFDVEPRVAMLSYSTGTSGKGSDVETVREATRIARERRPDLEIDGPIQYDAAVDASVGEKKMPGSSVAGRATVFVFPDLNTGNNTYKAVQRSAGAVAVGPVLQGLNKPVNDLSRGCLVPDVVNTVAITAIQAQVG